MKTYIRGYVDICYLIGLVQKEAASGAREESTNQGQPETKQVSRLKKMTQFKYEHNSLTS